MEVYSHTLNILNDKISVFQSLKRFTTHGKNLNSETKNLSKHCLLTFLCHHKALQRLQKMDHAELLFLRIYSFTFVAELLASTLKFNVCSEIG